MRRRGRRCILSYHPVIMDITFHNTIVLLVIVSYAHVLYNYCIDIFCSHK